MEHFARPDAWVCDERLAPLCERLASLGYMTGLASNYDHRLRSVAAGLEPLRKMNHLVISSEVGWRKPAPQFFEAVCRTVNLPADAILFIGDDRQNDFDGATRAGLPALLLDPQGKHADLGPRRISRLEQWLGDLLIRSLPASRDARRPAQVEACGYSQFIKN